MAPAQQSGPDSDQVTQVILHHLSDVRHTESVEEGSRDNILVQYERYLETLPRERYPDFVVITGDLTTNGTRAELSAVATTLRTCFARWKGSLNEHVVVVPGPHDVNWESIEGVGFQTFYDVFKDFATPTRAPASGWRDSPAGRVETIIGYPLDTCFSPDDLSPDLRGNFSGYVTYFGKFLDHRAKLGRRWLGMWKQPWRLRRYDRDRARERALQRLRNRYLELTEGARLIDLLAGRVSAKDAERFERWCQQQSQSTVAGAASAGSTPGDTAISPLKVLITHHPLDIRAEEDTVGTERQSTQYSFKQVVSAVRTGGFHLALHGHIHNPKLFSEQAVFEGPDDQRPLRQFGAASLGDTGVFNEITALYRREQGQGAWRLSLRLANLKVSNPAAISPLELQNQAEVAAKDKRQLERSIRLRRDFELRLRYIMRRFSEQVNQSRPDYRQSSMVIPPLPQDALTLVREVVSDVIFRGYETRVRLLLKNKEDRNSPVPRLVPTYLNPAILDGPDTLVYPASVAAWALALGRRLTFPEIKDEATNAEDHEWLRSTKKLPELLNALDALRQGAAAASDWESEQRYQALYTNLDAIKGASNGQSDARILGAKIYQATPGANPPRSFPAFICVPYPMRPAGGALPTVPEIAVLDIGVRPIENPDVADSAEMSAFPFDPFTKERIEMLETLTELIGLMLAAADALGKPRGVWNDPR